MSIINVKKSYLTFTTKNIAAEFTLVGKPLQVPNDKAHSLRVKW